MPTIFPQYCIIRIFIYFKVLVHGEHTEMGRLKAAIIREYEDKVWNNGRRDRYKFSENKRERGDWGRANSSPGFMAKCLLAELMLP